MKQLKRLFWFVGFICVIISFPISVIIFGFTAWDNTMENIIERLK